MCEEYSRDLKVGPELRLAKLQERVLSLDIVDLEEKSVRHYHARIQQSET